MRREFNYSHRLVSQGKKVLITKGVLSTPNPKKGKSLPVHVKDMVKEFYYSDTVSHAMPGKNFQKSIQTSESGFQSLQSYIQKNVSLQEQVVLTACVYVPFIKMLNS